MKSGMKTALLATVILSTGISAGMANFANNSEMGESTSPSFSALNGYGNFKEEYEHKNAFIPYSAPKTLEEKEDARVQRVNDINSISPSLVDSDGRKVPNDDVFYPILPDGYTSWAEVEADLIAYINDPTTTLEDISNLPTTPLGQSMIEWHERNEGLFARSYVLDGATAVTGTTGINDQSFSRIVLEKDATATNPLFDPHEYSFVDDGGSYKPGDSSGIFDSVGSYNALTGFSATGNFIVSPYYWLGTGLDALTVTNSMYDDALAIYDENYLYSDKVVNTISPVSFEEYKIDKITPEVIASVDGYFEHDIATVTLSTLDTLSTSTLHLDNIDSIYNLPINDDGDLLGDITIFGLNIFAPTFDINTVAPTIIAMVDDLIEAAVEPGAFHEMIVNSIHDVIDEPLATLATTIQGFVQGLIDYVDAIDDQIDIINGYIDAVNNAVLAYNELITEINIIIDNPTPDAEHPNKGINQKIGELETTLNTYITTYNNDTSLTVDDITDVELIAINAQIDIINTNITSIEDVFNGVVASINAEIESIFGDITSFMDYVNEAIMLTLINIEFTELWATSNQYLVDNNINHWENIPQIDAGKSNEYEDTVNKHRVNSLDEYEALTSEWVQTGIDADGWGTWELQPLPYIFTEKSLTPTGGTELAIDGAHPQLTETTAETYDLTYTVAVREGVDYLPFASDKISIYADEYDWTTSTLTEASDSKTFEYTVSSPTSVATNEVEGASTYNVNLYDYTIKGLEAGIEYTFYMEDNYVDGYEDWFQGISNATRINAIPVVHYMPNEVTLKPLSLEIGTVDLTADFTVADAVTAWDIDLADISIEATKTSDGSDVSSLFTIDNYVDDGTGTSTFTVHADSGLIPNTEYKTDLYISSKDIDSDGDIDIDDKELKWTATWMTQNWLDPYPPEITSVTVTQPEWSDLDPTDATGDRKHEATIDFSINVPSNDEALGEDTTVVTGASLYYLNDLTLGGDGTTVYTPGEDNSSLLVPTDVSSTNGYTTHYTDQSLLTGTYNGTFDLAGLQLGTDYSFVIQIDYEGKNLVTEDPTNAYFVVSSLDDNSADGGKPPYDISFTTEGLDPANAPSFTPGSGFVGGAEPATTTTTWTTTFSIVDPMTVVDTTNTVLEDPTFYIGTTSGSLSPLVAGTDYDLVWDNQTAWDNRADDNPTADVTHTGTVTFKNLTPNTDYFAQMQINSNYWADATVQNVSSWDSNMTPIMSDEITDKTLKEDALPPIWDPNDSLALSYVDWTPTTLTYDFKFLVPVDDMIHKNTVFDNLGVYVGPTGSTLTEIFEHTGPVPDPDDTTQGYKPAYILTWTNEGTTQETVESQSYNVFTGTVDFIGLEANTEYDMQLGIRSHSYDDDLVAPDDVADLPEVKSPIVTHVTKKFPARDPWWNENDGATSYDIQFVSSDISNPNTPDQKVEATIAYDFWLPTHDEAYFDTILTGLPVYLWHGVDVVPVVQDTDYVINEELHGSTVAGVGDHFTGTIVFKDLLPEESYSVQVGIVTDSENDIDEDAYIPPEQKSTQITFETEKFPAKAPYFGDEDKENGFSYSEFTDTTITFNFDFTIPADEHGYYPTDFNALNVYISEDSSDVSGSETWSLLSESTDYFIEWETSAPTTTTRGTVKGKVTYKNLQPATTYHYRLGLDTAYYLEVFSPTIIHSTAFGKATPPSIEISDSPVYFYGDDPDETAKPQGWYIDLKVITNNEDPADARADTLVTKINVGTYDTTASVTTQEEIAAAVKTKDYYMNEYTVPTAENGAGVASVDYSKMLKSTTLDFASTYDDMVISVDWGDDGTSYESSSGTVYAIVPEFTTPDLEIINPAFQQAYVSETTTTTATINYSIGLLDPDGPYPDSNSDDFDLDMATWVEEPEAWQAHTYISKLYVKGNEGIDVLNPGGGSSDSTKEDTSILYYTEDNPSMTGSITLELPWGYMYSGMTIYADYASYKESDLDAGLPIAGATELEGGSGTISIVIEDFETDIFVPDPDFPYEPEPDPEWETLTPELDPLDPVEPEKPVDPGEGDEDVKSGWWIFLALIIIFSGITLAIVLYPMIKED